MAAAKLLLPQETFTPAGMSQYCKDKLNEHLPDDIRCFSISKVPKSFRGREECTLRCGRGRRGGGGGVTVTSICWGVGRRATAKVVFVRQCGLFRVSGTVDCGATRAASSLLHKFDKLERYRVPVKLSVLLFSSHSV